MNPTNLTDEGLSKRAVEVVNEAREALTGMVAGETTFKKFWEPRILSALQQVRDAAKKEEREACAKVAESHRCSEVSQNPIGTCGDFLDMDCRGVIATAIRALDGR